MHAMMSTGTRRYDGHGDAALREARRVLSAAEPGDGRRVPAFRVEWGAAPTWERAEASLDAGAPYFKALAESLASFVAATDPAAYLAAVSQ